MVPTQISIDSFTAVGACSLRSAVAPYTRPVRGLGSYGGPKHRQNSASTCHEVGLRTCRSITRAPTFSTSVWGALHLSSNLCPMASRSFLAVEGVGL